MSLEAEFIPDDTQAAQHHADMVAFRREAEEALRASLTRPLTEHEVAAIAWWGNLVTRRPPLHMPPRGDPF